MARYDEAFVERFLAPWNRHDVDGALALMTDDCVWEVPRGRAWPTLWGALPSISPASSIAKPGCRCVAISTAVASGRLLRRDSPKVRET